MGKIPYFTKVFIVGILLFFSFYMMMDGGNFLVGPSYRFVPPERSNRSVSEPEINLPEDDFVGTREVEDLRHIYLMRKPFKISYVTEKKSFIQEDELTVKNGILESKEYNKIFSLTEDDLNKMKSVSLLGEVYDTNLYGRLIFGLNGKEIFSEPLKTGESFEIPIDISFFSEDNEFLVTSESSGWRMWAPTVYKLRNLELKSDFVGTVSQSFNFYVGEKETPVNLGRIIINFDEIEGDGKLFVNVNGVNVFSDTPRFIQWIDFEDIIREGDNLIEMSSERGTEFTARDAEIIIFWDREASEELEMNFYLTGSQHRRLPGEIKFKIEKIFETPTSLVATVENPDGDKHSLVVQGVLDEGNTISLRLPKNYAGVGENKVIFSVTGSGGYTISDFHVDL